MSQNQDTVIPDTSTVPISRGPSSDSQTIHETDRKARRSSLRAKFDQYLKESTKDNNNDRYDEALEKLRQDPDANDFNLVCRMKGDQKTGLIILNRIAKAKAKEPEPEPEPEPEQEHDITPNYHNEEMEEFEPTPPPAPKISRRAYARRATPPTPTVRIPKRPSTKKEISEAQMVALANKVDALWRKIDHMKAKKKEHKLNKEANRTMKELLIAKAEKEAPKSQAGSFFDRLDRASLISTGSIRGGPTAKTFMKMF